jgi:hypothetical protein
MSDNFTTESWTATESGNKNLNPQVLFSESEILDAVVNGPKVRLVSEFESMGVLAVRLASARISSLWLGFDSWNRHHIIVKFAVFLSLV